MRPLRIQPLILILLFGLSACASNPATNTTDFVMMSENDELQLGQQAAAEVNKNITLLDEKDPLVRYVDRVGQKMAALSDRPELFYRFHVVDDATINAFALPGGYIYMHRGLLNHMNSEAELAAVLGHEIGHVTARHFVKQYSKAQAYQVAAAITSIFVPIPQSVGMLSNLLASAVLSGYGRDAELQSDELSVKYLTRAGYDPDATVGVLKTLKRLADLSNREKTDAGDKVKEYHGAFASHPKTEKRIREAVVQAKSTQQGSGTVNRNAMAAAVDGYPYGDSPDQGAVVGRRFLHPDLGIQLEFPEGWVITNTPVSLNARMRQKDVYFQLRLEELTKRQTPTELLNSGFPKRHIKVIRTGNQAGMPFVHAEVTMSAPHVSQAKIDVHLFIKGRQAFVMLMWSKRDDFIHRMRVFADIAYSFDTYDESEGDIPRISLHTWKHNDSWQQLAALNGMDVSQQPDVGSVIKIVC